MDIQQKLQAFTTQYTGVSGVGDTPENKSQCVGIIEVWLDQFQLPHIWGNAKDLLTNAPSASYTIITNTPTNSPSPGDIFVFGSTYGNGFGHTGVVITADVNSITLFQQNDPEGSTPHIKSYNYTGALGWIHPNIFSPTVTQTVTDQQVTDQLNAQIQATNNCQTQLKSATEQNSTLQQELTDSENKVKSLSDEKTDLSNQIAKLQTLLKSEQEEIANLNDQIAKDHNSNKDYATEALTLTNDNKDLTNYLFAIADRLGINRVNEKSPAIAEAVLTKLDSIDLLLKAGGVAKGLLHEVAQFLQVDDPNVTDKDIADRIIEYVKGLQGKLQNILPTQEEQNIVNQIKMPSFGAKLVGFFWQSKTT